MALSQAAWFGELVVIGFCWPFFLKDVFYLNTVCLCFCCKCRSIYVVSNCSFLLRKRVLLFLMGKRRVQECVAIEKNMNAPDVHIKDTKDNKKRDQPLKRTPPVSSVELLQLLTT